MNKKTQINKEIFSQLHNFVFDGKYDLIDQWFLDNPLDKKNSELFIKFLFEETYFFSFRCQSLNRFFIKEETQLRHKSILKNLSFENQIKILDYLGLFYDINDVDSSYINLLKPYHKKDEIDALLFQLIQKKFHLEDFDFLDSLNTKLQINIFSINSNRIAFFYDKSGAAFLSLNNSYCLKDLLPISYSNNKYEYLLKNKIYPPNLEHAELLKNDIFDFVSEAKPVFHFLTPELINSFFIKYNKEYFDKSIPQQDNDIKKIKKI